MAIIALTPPLYINVKQYGAAGDGVTDDTTAIQNALTAAASVQGSVVFFPQGVYLITATLQFGGYTSILGVGDSPNGTVIRVKTGTALTTPILASSNWYTNTTTCGNPVHIADIKLDGNSAMSGTGGHGFVPMNYQSCFERLSITNVTGHGAYFSAFTQNGTHITNTCVEAKFSKIQVRTTGLMGIYVHDDGTTLNSCTDGFLEDCIVTGAGTRGIYVEMSPGWYIAGNHIYGTGTDALYANRCYATRVVGNYIDGYGSGGATFIAGIAMDCLDGRGSSCLFNHIGFENGTATGPYQAFRWTGAGSASTVLVTGYNTVNGGSQGGSIGFLIQTNVSQRTHPWIVYRHHNDAQNVANYQFDDGYEVGGNTQVPLHIASIQYVAPTATAGGGSGTTPPAPVLNNCSDLNGQVTFGTGTTPSSGVMVNVVFNQAYTHSPAVVVTAINSSTVGLNLYVISSTTGFSVSCTSTPSASQTNTHYGFNYLVMA